MMASVIEVDASLSMAEVADRNREATLSEAF